MQPTIAEEILKNGLRIMELEFIPRKERVTVLMEYAYRLGLEDGFESCNDV